MKKLILFASAMLFCVLLAASPRKVEENPVTQDVNIVEFTDLSVSIPCVINYEAGEPAMRIEGFDRSVKNVLVKNVNGKLTITSERKLVRNLSRIVITLSSSTLNSVSVNGAAEFRTVEGFENTELSISVNGAGIINASNVTADNLKVTVNGAGKLNMTELFCQESLKFVINGAGDAVVAGYAKNANVKINGAGGVDIIGLSTEKLSTTVNGVGSIRCE